MTVSVEYTINVIYADWSRDKLLFSSKIQLNGQSLDLRYSFLDWCEDNCITISLDEHYTMKHIDKFHEEIVEYIKKELRCEMRSHKIFINDLAINYITKYLIANATKEEI